MGQPINRYKADLRETKFLLFEQFGLNDLLGKEPYKEWAQDDVEMILDELYKWCCEVIGPLNAVGDQQGCKLVDGKVITPDGFKEAWKSLYEAGWRSLAVPEEYGGQGGPYVLAALADEMASSANISFNMYPGLTIGVAEVIEQFGSEAQKKRFLPPLFEGKVAGTMCLTEPHAGSDVGASTTKATLVTEGEYQIEGTKMFITAGDHDLAGNIYHLVLARTPGAPSGTKGLSLFVVPRDKLEGGSNDVLVGNLEHKMGIKGSSTALLNFGENENCIGYLVGTEEQQGMKQMFHLMNLARIGVGLQGLAQANLAYMNALDYAKERKQGSLMKDFKNPDAPKVEIIKHADVRRMLLDMKSRTEGIRALAVKLSMHVDREKVARLEGDKDQAHYHQGQVDLLVPLLKAYGSDQAFTICATAMQVFGGAGYVSDHPVEQACRDAKIFSIYEGTNHIQALDLVGRKLGYKGGVNLQAFIGDISKFIGENRDHPELGDSVDLLGKASQAVGATAMRFLGWFQGGKMDLVPLAANRFLEMMSETVVGWLLLEGAVIAGQKVADLADDHPDKNFYIGKKYSAIYFAQNVLPTVNVKGDILAKEETTPIDIPEEAFATI